MLLQSNTKPKARLFWAILLVLSSSSVFSQTEHRSFTVKHISQSIVADGVLDEPIWQTAESVNDYWQYFPSDSVKAQQQSEIKMLYDDKNLYVGIKVKAVGKNYALTSLKRDYRGGGNDSFTVLFDTYGDGTNAFLFGINPYGVRREGLISGGGNSRFDYSLSWDVKWQADSRIYDDYYTSEMIIPLTSLKFKEGAKKWRFNSYRIDTQSNERSSWSRIPQNQMIFNTAFMGDMVFENHWECPGLPSQLFLMSTQFPKRILRLTRD